MNEIIDARKDMSALMAAVLQKDWDGFVLMVDMLTEDEAKNVTVATMGFLGQAIRDFAKHADMEPLQFWLHAMEGHQSEE